MICNDDVCNCAMVSTTLDITGSGTPSDPLVIEQSEFSDLAAINSDIANINAELDTLPGVYVSQAGDGMLGRLSITVGSGASLTLVQTGTDTPYLEYRQTDGTRVAYIQILTSTPALLLQAEAGHGLAMRTNGSNDRMRIESDGDIFMHKTVQSEATVGQEFLSTGEIRSTADTLGVINFRANRTGAADANLQVYASFRSAGTQIGRIERVSASSANIVASSDRDMKENIEPIDDDLALLWLRLVEPVFYESKGDPTHQRQVGYIAQDVADIWPNGAEAGVVSQGHGNAEDRTWDEMGNETTPEDLWSPWGFCYGMSSAYVHAAAQALDRHVADLTERVTALEDVVKPKPT